MTTATTVASTSNRNLPESMRTNTVAVQEELLNETTAYLNVIAVTCTKAIGNRFHSKVNQAKQAHYYSLTEEGLISQSYKVLITSKFNFDYTTRSK